MSIIVRAESAVVLLIIALGVMGLAPSKTKLLRGRIIAFRNVDRVVQAASFIPNKEIFLFQVAPTKDNKRPTTVKLEYCHFGYSDITGEMLQQAVPLTVKANRDESCDQSYAELISAARALPEETPRSVTPSGIVFVEKFKGIEFGPDLMLKCYTVQEGGFQVTETQNR